MASLTGRYGDTRRILELLQLLRGRERGLAELREALGVSASTLRRDLAFLREGGFKLTQRWEDGRKRVSCKLALFPLPKALAVWLLLGAEVFDELDGSVIAQELRWWRDLAVTQLGLEGGGALGRRFYQRPRARARREGAGEALDEVIDGIRGDRLLHIRYRTHAGELRELDIEPWTLARLGERLYVLGPPAGEPEPLLWRLDRVLEAHRGRERFELPESYDPADLFAHRMGAFMGRDRAPERIVLRVGPRWAASLAEERLPVRRVGQEGDTITLRAVADQSLRQWLLRMGAEVEVVHPLSLREEVARAAEQTLARYALSAPEGAEAVRVRLRVMGETAELLRGMPWPEEVRLTEEPEALVWEGVVTPTRRLSRWLRAIGEELLAADPSGLLE